MINRITAFADSKGNTYGTLDAAQRAEIKLLMTGNSVGIAADSVSEDRIAEWVLTNKDKIVDILTTKPNSLTKARKVNGGTKTRTPKPKRHEAEQFTMPIEDSRQATEAEKLAAAR
jgi:hypothetical protein